MLEIPSFRLYCALKGNIQKLAKNQILKSANPTFFTR